MADAPLEAHTVHVYRTSITILKGLLFSNKFSIVRNCANTWRTMTRFCKQICWQKSAEDFETTAVKGRQKKKSRNFANKSLTEKFYENLVHFVRWAIRE
jgi:hypothetical protein